MRSMLWQRATITDHRATRPDNRFFYSCPLFVMRPPVQDLFNVERVFSETPCTVKPTCHVDTRRVSANISWSELRTGVNGPTQILQCSTTCRAAVHNLSPHRLPRSKVPSTCRRRPRVPPSLHGNGAAGILGTWVFLLLLLSEIFKCNKFTAYQTYNNK